MATSANQLANRTEGYRFLIAIKYEGPFEILSSALWSVTDDDIILEIPNGSFRDRLAVVADRLDCLWREWYALKRQEPPRAWRRRL